MYPHAPMHVIHVHRRLNSMSVCSHACINTISFINNQSLHASKVTLSLILSLPLPDVTYTQIIGSFTNEGVVDLCNMSLSVQNLGTAYYKSPDWMPRYPQTSSIKARSYFPFTVIMVRPPGEVYPLVTIPRTFYACDKDLKQLTGDAVFPPPGWVPPPELQAEARMTLPPTSSKGSVVSGSGGGLNWKALIAYDTKCLSACSEVLYQEKVLCVGMKYLMSSGCAKSCGTTTVDWLKSQCQQSKCGSDVCAWGGGTTTTTHSRARSSKTFSIILLSGIYGMFFIIKFFYH